MNEKLEKAIVKLAERAAAECMEPSAAMQYAQAALNIAHAGNILLVTNNSDQSKAAV